MRTARTVIATMIRAIAYVKGGSVSSPTLATVQWQPQTTMTAASRR
jgi:hypothetical protein